MPSRRSVTRIAVEALLVAAGGLAIGADRFSALAQRLDDAIQADPPGGVDGGAAETPPGRAGGEDGP